MFTKIEPQQKNTYIIKLFIKNAMKPESCLTDLVVES